MVDPIKNHFNELYDALFYKVTCFTVSKCNNLEAVEDIVQDVFLELYKIIQKNGTGYIENPEAIIMRITKFKLFKHYNLLDALKNNISFFKQNEEGEEYECEYAEDFDVEDKYINYQTIEEIWTYLKKKTVETQKIFTLYYYSGKTIKEIAEMLKKTESYVKHKLYRTLAEVRKIYKKEI
jgi:RNA polymerase sigma-70 factor (ECF subfamily)